MRLLGLDYGEKRVGIAISDGLGITAQAKGCIEYKELDKLIQAIKNIIKEEGISKIVLGLPLGSDDQETAQTKKTREFGNLIEKEIGLPLEYSDEGLTTCSAEDILISAGMSRKKRKKKIDGLAAQIMLQEYMNTL
ncbi:Holliday junction resolvase RuvX [bacterium]|nr:Holliday junction resolvase RuvX [bacterium]